MGQVKNLLATFKNEQGSDISSFVDNTLNKLLYEDGSIESDLRALVIKSADLRKKGAVYHSLVKNKKEYNEKMHNVVDQLSKTQAFLKYVASKMPDRAKQINETLKANDIYLGVHSH